MMRFKTPCVREARSSTTLNGLNYGFNVGYEGIKEPLSGGFDPCP